MHQCIFQSHVPAAAAAVVSQPGRATWGDLRQQVRDLIKNYRFLEGKRVGLCMRASPLSLAALAAFDHLACDVLLMLHGLEQERCVALAKHFELATVLEEAKGRFLARFNHSGDASRTDCSTVTLLTSGTSGAPKAVRYTWERLSRPVRPTPEYPAPRWLLTYQPHLYAGLQVILQCFFNGGALVIAGPSAREVSLLMRQSGVQFASATPSYWRWLLTWGDLKSLKQTELVQVTLGGEIVDQAILDSLRTVFPNARLIHIYATTELGRCFSVRDGKAGFPASFVDQCSPDGVALKVENGELLVRSANAMQGYIRQSRHASPRSEFFATGDLVKRVGGRFYFVGRKNDIINVGGNKVHPAEVEAVILAVPGVADVRVYGKTSSVTGQLVACDIVTAEGEDPEKVVGAVRSSCLQRLPSHARPRFFERRDSIALSVAGKKRREAED